MGLKGSVPAILLACCVFVAAVNSVAADSLNRRLLQSRSNIYPRYSIAEIDAMDDREPYKILMLLAWRDMTTSTQRRDVLSYWRLAGIHGMAWPYNGIDAPSEGFCKHRGPDFGPWHRAYMKMFEDYLIKTCFKVADRFQDRSLREEYQGVAESCRLPYWDWTKSRLPNIITASRVQVIDEDGSNIEVRNPFAGYQYVASTGTGRSSGMALKRARNWASAMSNGAGQFGRQMASFVRSNTWRCTYTNTRTCFGNLEQVHNDIHNILGGTSGEMATILYAGFDPLFWLHHCQLDRALWLFQNNNGQWTGQDNYTPFQTLGGAASDVSSYGYTYSGTRGLGSGSRSSKSSRSAMRLESLNTTSATIGSAAAKAAVRVALHEWTGNYTGYAWAVRFQDLNERQMEIPAHVYVFLNTPEARISSLPAKVEDFNDLRMHPNYCGSASGFNDYTHDHANTIVNRAVDLTDCLMKAKMNPDVPAANPTDLSRGPAKVPVKLTDLKFVAVNAEGEDVTDKYNFGRPVISWSLPVTRTASQVRASMLSEVDAVEARALAAPTALDGEMEVFSIEHGDVE